MDSTRRSLSLYFTERFVHPPSNTAVRTSGLLDTKDGSVAGEVLVRKRFVPKLLDALDVSLRYGSDAWEPLRYSLSAKKTWPLTEDELLTVDLKGRVNFGHSRKELSGRSSVELSRKIYYFTEGQDLKMMLGYDLLNNKAYAKLRENNWTFNTDFRGNWMLLYDL